MKDYNLRLIVVDELGDEYCPLDYTLPNPEELTRDEVEAFKAVLLSRVWIGEEARGHYWIEDFKCKTDLEAEEAEWEARYEELLEECDGNEDEAWDLLQDERREAYEGKWW